MSTDTINIEEQETNLLNELQGLLEKQVKSIKNGDYRAVEAAVEQANTVVAELTTQQSPQPAQSKERYECLVQLYRKLTLMIEAEKDSVNRQLRKIKRGKKTIGTYQDKI